MRFENAIKWFLEDYCLTTEEATKLSYLRKIKRWVGEKTVGVLALGALTFHYIALSLDDEYCRYP